MRVNILALTLLLNSPVAFAKAKPVPRQVIDAKSVRLTCNGEPCVDPIFSSAKKALAKWGRYTLILDGGNADLIFAFKIGSPHEGLAQYQVLSPSGNGSITDIGTQDAPKMQDVKK